MEEKEKLIVFFLSRIGSGAWPLVNPLFSCVFCVSGETPVTPCCDCGHGCVYWGLCEMFHMKHCAPMWGYDISHRCVIMRWNHCGVSSVGHCG